MNQVGTIAHIKFDNPSINREQKKRAESYQVAQAYSRFCMAMIIQGLRDLLSSNEKIREKAWIWFMHSSPEKPVEGITFDECCHAMESRLRLIGYNESIDINAFRRQCLENPEKMLRARGNNVSPDANSKDSGLPVHILHIENIDIFE